MYTNRTKVRINFHIFFDCDNLCLPTAISQLMRNNLFYNTGPWGHIHKQSYENLAIILKLRNLNNFIINALNIILKILGDLGY